MAIGSFQINAHFHREKAEEVLTASYGDEEIVEINLG